MDALGQLDRMRREAVEDARLALVDARALHTASERAHEAALRDERTCERALSDAQRTFSLADTVPMLRAAEALLEACRSERARLAARVHACELARANTLAALRQSEHAVRDAELGRRAVERKLAQRAADVGRRAERQLETEAEESFRPR